MSILSFWKNPKKRNDCSQYESVTTIKATLLAEEYSYKSQNTLYHCFYVLYFAKVKRYVLNNSGSEADALDVFQDSMIALLGKIQEFEINSDAFGPYFMGISTKLWIGRLRRKSATERPTDFTTEHFDEDSEDMNELWEIIEDTKLLEKAIATLSEKEQQFIRLFYFEEKSYIEIAAKMNQNANSLKANRGRIIQKLRNYMFENQ